MRRARCDSHYAPHAELRLNAEAPRDGETYLGFGSLHAHGPYTLSAGGDLVEAAANLFRLLHEIDATGVDRDCRGAHPAPWAGRSHQRPAAARGGTEADAMTVKPSQATLDRLAAVVGERHAIRDAGGDGRATCTNGAICGGEPRRSCCGRSSTAEVSRILAIADETATAIVPQSGNTGSGWRADSASRPAARCCCRSTA